MSHISRPLRGLAAAGVLAAAALGTAASAQAADLTLNYACTYPLIGAQPLSIAINATIPSSVPAGSGSGVFDIKATATASGNTPSGINILGAKTLEGTATAKATFTIPGSNVPALTVPITIPQQSVGGSGNIVINATGSTPSVKLPNPGTAKVTVDSLSLNLIARDAAGKAIPVQKPGAADSDGNPDTFDVTCTLNPSGQSTTLATIPVTDAGSAPGTTSPSVQPPAPAPAPSTGDVTKIDYGYSLTGAATLKNLVSGGLPLGGTIGAHLTLPSGDFTGDLALTQTTGNLRALGILPVVATVQLLPTGPVTGSLRNGILNATANVDIHLRSVTLAGIPLVSGANCRALNTSVINLKSTASFFQPLSGGTLAGSFAISDLVGCGPLNGIVSPLTKGGGNAIALQLTPKV
ncbi:MAG: DUF6801 domain-containing protein [Solirubrobacteraceae bacterium]|nr:hypothetical protein [Patulibacter sp.]